MKMKQWLKQKNIKQITALLLLILTSYNLWCMRTNGLKNQHWYEVLDRANDNIIEIKQKMNIPVVPQKEELKLNCLYACLMDGESQRVLYAKDAYKEVPMASTTKIMTLLTVLEQGNLDDIVTVSSNAARQPDVQLNINTGEKYILRDLCYSLMLESHNDTAVAIAEHVGGTVEHFCELMTQRANELGATHTSFKTPNGLDADGHYTTAYDLSLIASYAIQNKEFCKIVGTTTHQFDEVNRKRSFTVNNKDRFLYMMEGAIGIKTGFTGKAGYCFVGAIRLPDKTLISTVLGSGWPPHKEYKWADTKRLMNYGLDNFQAYYLIEKMQNKEELKIPSAIKVVGGKQETAAVALKDDITNEKMLFRSEEAVTTKIDLQDSIVAPCKQGTVVGYVTYSIDEMIHKQVPILLNEEIEKVDLFYLLKKLLQM